MFKEMPTFAFLSALTWFLIRSLVIERKKELEMLTDSLKKEFEAQRKSLESVNENLMRTARFLLQLEIMFIKHDARVRGINPSVGANEKERLEEAEKHYKEILDFLKTDLHNIINDYKQKYNGGK